MEYLNGPPKKGCHSRAEAKLADISRLFPDIISNLPIMISFAHGL